MAAELSDMAEPPAVPPPPPPPSSSSSSSASPSGEEAAESEAASASSSSSSSSSSSTSAAGVEAEPPPAALNGEGAESMSEPSPESASQAGDGDDEEEEDGDDEEEDDDDEEEEEEEDDAEDEDDEEEEEEEAEAGSSSGCCTDDARSLSPGGSEADVKGGSGGAGVGAGGGPDGSGGGGGGGSSGGDSSEASAAPQASAASSEGDAGTGGSSGGASAGADEGYGTGSGGGGGSSSCSATSGGRRGSLEISSDGEPLSRMDSEDSISSTIMDVDSTISSGRSTPVMMNGQGVTTSSAKSIAYNCCWDQCHSCFNSSPDLADHIRSIHVDGQRGGVFVCLWKGCKVYNTPSTSQSWLQRHMLTHSGDKPFKCVVGGCNASFASQSGLARHVPTHFSQQNSSKVTNQPKAKEESPSKAGMNKRKKLKNKRRRSLRLVPDCAGELLTTDKRIGVVTRHARPHDFFDAQTLDAIRHRAICFNLSAHIESLGKGHSVVFHSTVMAKRKEDSGKVKLLLHWTPEDILPDVWVNESERHQLKTKVVHLSKLPKDTALLLDPNIYRTMPQKRLKR
ncbi:zinc finger protein AEBP2 isoform X2 [Pantherophis guttatus]|uniref:Zinc finger protein AEBP2 isoform X2 n=1 Tax=Pantherophis guttatus TaxID=94885 RepID=A0A6P9DRT1_PANGU|nr:zinc finger protein AEBP2 isoform X2 [Pantherophis guttatus]